MPSAWGCPEGARHHGACAHVSSTARIHPRPDFGLGRRPPGWRPHSSTDGWLRPMTQGGATFAARMLLCPGLGWGRPLGALHSGQGRHNSVRAASAAQPHNGPTGPPHVSPGQSGVRDERTQRHPGNRCPLRGIALKGQDTMGRAHMFRVPPEFIRGLISVSAGGRRVGGRTPRPTDGCAR